MSSYQAQEYLRKLERESGSKWVQAGAGAGVSTALRAVSRAKKRLRLCKQTIGLAGPVTLGSLALVVLAALGIVGWGFWFMLIPTALVGSLYFMMRLDWLESTEDLLFTAEEEYRVALAKSVEDD